MNSQWKLVPVEPTETMVINGFESVPNECFTDEEVWEQYQEMSGCQQAAFRAKLCWAAMLGAAPAATAIPAAWLDPNSIQQGEILSAQAKMNSDLLGQQDRALRFSVPLYAHPDAGDVARLTAERDALQQRLNAADQRIDEQCALMRRLVRNVDQETCCAEDLEQDDQFNYILKSMRKAITAPQ
ncbi:hypothetical protein [Pseudomonas sp. S2_C03]